MINTILLVIFRKYSSRTILVLKHEKIQFFYIHRLYKIFTSYLFFYVYIKSLFLMSKGDGMGKSWLFYLRGNVPS